MIRPLLTLLLALLWAAPAMAAGDEQEAWQAMEWLDDQLVFRPGDDLAWADPDLDDRDWIEPVLNRPWRHWPTGSRDWEWGWYRMRLPVTPGEPVGVFVYRATDAAELYIDGERVALHGDPERHVAASNLPFAGVAPQGATDDGEIVVALRVWGGSYRGGGDLSAVWVGHPDAVLAAVDVADQRSFDRLVGPGRLFVALVLVAMGLFHGVLWWRRREPEQGLFALGALLFGLSGTHQALLFLNLLPITILFHLTVGVVDAIGYIALLWFVVRFFGYPGRRWVTLVSAWLALGATVFLLDLPSPAPTVTFAGNAVAALTGLWILGWANWHRRPYARWVAAGFIPLITQALGDGVNFVYPLGPWYMSQVYGVRTFLWISATGAISAGMSAALVLRMGATLDDLEATWRATAQFVPDALLALLGRSKITEVQRGDSTSTEATVMFCGIRDFSSRAEGWSPERSFAFLNEVLAAIEPEIHAHGGIVAQYLGDGFLAIFPKGVSRPVAAAVAIQQAAPDQLAIGMHTGSVMLGTIGSDTRLTTAQVSDVVNSAARIKGLSAHYGAPLVISEATRALVQDEGWALHELDAVVMKGKAVPIKAFEVLGGEPDPSLRTYKQAQAGTYTQALRAFRSGDFAGARALFAPLAERWAAAKLFVDRCDWFLAHGLPDDWDGVFRMTVK